MRDLRCKGCGRRVGFTPRTQAVPVQCTDPFCAVDVPVSINEERDSFIVHLVEVAGHPPDAVGKQLGMTRQNVDRVVAARR